MQAIGVGGLSLFVTIIKNAHLKHSEISSVACPQAGYDRAAEPSTCTVFCPLPTAFSSTIPGTTGPQRTAVLTARREDRQARYVAISLPTGGNQHTTNPAKCK